MKKSAVLLLLVFALTTALHAQFWQKKSPQEWSKSDCQKMLTDSPWARTSVVTQAFVEPFGVGPHVPGRESRPEVRYEIRFLSALPVRQALVRQVQLSPEFARLQAEERKSLEERQADWLNTEYRDHIVIQVAYSTNVPGYQAELERAWSGPTANQLRLNTVLHTPTGRLELVDVLRPQGGGELHLVYPRNINGRPALQPGDKNVSLDFVHPSVGVLGTLRVVVEFKVKDMMLDGQFVY